MDSDVKHVLDSIQGYENIPRKRAKFINFCKNVLARKSSPASIEKTWDLFEKALKEPQSAPTKPSEDIDTPMETTSEISNGTENKKSITACSFNQWETANLGNDQTNEKFRRLMGMGKSGSATKPINSTSQPHASSVQDSTNLFSNQEKEYEKARAMTLSGRGQGLGFASAIPDEKKKRQNKRQTFDDESDNDGTNGKENGHSISNGNKLDCDSNVHQNGIPMFKGTAKEEKNSEKTKKKKRKAIDEDSAEENQSKKAKVIENTDNQVKFDWIDCALTVITKKGSIKMKKLKKKVINEYVTHYPDTIKTKVELETKFQKKIDKSKKLKISNDIVSISTSRDE